MNPLQRLRLVKELAQVKTDAKGAAALAKLKLLKRASQILIELGIGTAPTPEPAPDPAQGALDFLQSIVDGKQDGLGEEEFIKLAYRMDESAQIIVNSERKGEGDSVIDSAVTHWAKFADSKGWLEAA